jgi:hypothetical protein
MFFVVVHCDCDAPLSKLRFVCPPCHLPCHISLNVTITVIVTFTRCAFEIPIQSWKIYLSEMSKTNKYKNFVLFICPSLSSSFCMSPLSPIKLSEFYLQNLISTELLSCFLFISFSVSLSNSVRNTKETLSVFHFYFYYYYYKVKTIG